MSWQRLLGHDSLVEAFTKVVRGRRLAHAYLFVGPRGVGKRLFAEELAKSLLCERAGGQEVFAACDRCDACRQVEARTHPDFFHVGRPEDKNEVPISVMRELCQSFGLKPARGRGKVALLDDADDLNEESANCFLKTLEEPPPRSVFILIGTALERQMATVLSRCQVVRFAPLPPALIEELLRRQGVTDAGLLPRLVRLAGGSPGLALELADAALWQCRRMLIEGLAKPVPDTVGLARTWIEFVEEAGKEAPLQRQRAKQVLRLLVGSLKDALMFVLGAAPQGALADEAQMLQNLSRRLSPERILQMLERCLEAEIHIDRYLQLSLVLEGLLDALGQMCGPATTAAR